MRIEIAVKKLEEYSSLMRDEEEELYQLLISLYHHHYNLNSEFNKHLFAEIIEIVECLDNDYEIIEEEKTIIQKHKKLKLR